MLLLVMLTCAAQTQEDEALPPDASHLPDVEEEEPGPSEPEVYELAELGRL